MPILKIFTLTFIFIVFFYVRLYGDIIVTKDDMILNGKIIEDKQNDYIKFANYHGTFHIEYKQIKEIHRTKSYEEDIKIYQDKGKSVDEAEVKTNYQAGLEKLEEQGKITEKIPAEEKQKETFALVFSPFYNFNYGKLSGKLPQSYGFSALGHVPLDQFENIKKIYLSGIGAELAYFHSEKGARQVSGLRLSAGPLWKFPVSFGNFRFNYCVLPEIGAGLYNIRSIYSDTTTLKMNLLFSTGPIFNFSSILLYPNIRFDYIYDGVVPLCGIGFGIGAGFYF
ncbi:MAG: hypothetical protein JXN64_09185 [Spirochaetes bacterium]|nr:hypothetical protein [Spirochaetota bacterium]